MTQKKRSRNDDSQFFIEVLVRKLQDHGADVPKELRTLILAIRHNLTICVVVDLVKALSKDLKLKIPISRTHARRHRELVRTLLAANIKKELDQKKFVHDSKVVEELERNEVKLKRQDSSLTVIASV